MEEVILFVLTFLFVLLLYELLIVRRAMRKDKKKSKKKSKEPMEVSYLVRRYGLDLEKVNYNRLLQVIAFVSSFDIVLVVGIVLWLQNFLLRLLAGLVASIVIILISYHIVYLVYKKKGMIKDES